jgi:membrane protease YdiL (CAAX protease family)
MNTSNQSPANLISGEITTIVASESSLQSTSERYRLIASPWHTLLMLVVGLLNAYGGVIRAVNARAGLGLSRPHMYLRAMLFEFLFLALVVLGVRLRGTPLATIFGQRWRSVSQMVRDLGVGLLLLLVSTLMVSILSGHHGEVPSDKAIEYLIPRTSLELFIWIALSITAGICEEAIYRGYFQHQFTGLTHSVHAGILVSGAAFAAAHAYQGFQRALVIGVSAVLFGLFAQWRGTVRPGMFAHTLQDAIAPLLIKLIRH